MKRVQAISALACAVLLIQSARTWSATYSMTVPGGGTIIELELPDWKEEGSKAGGDVAARDGDSRVKVDRSEVEDVEPTADDIDSEQRC